MIVAATQKRTLNRRPSAKPNGSATEKHARKALMKAAEYLDAGGYWSDPLREYVDNWLDILRKPD